MSYDRIIGTPPKTASLYFLVLSKVIRTYWYGFTLGSQDAACPRSTYELAIEEAIANRGRLALVGDRRLV
jgi:hypothetical protein